MFFETYAVLVIPVSAELPFENHLDMLALAVSTGLLGRAPVGVQVVSGRYREDLCPAATTITTQPPVPLPAGAVRAEEWEGEGDDRGRFFLHPPVQLGDVQIAIRGVQDANGNAARSILIELDPSLGRSPADFTPLYARRLAAMLQNFADTCEILDEAR